MNDMQHDYTDALMPTQDPGQYHQNNPALGCKTNAFPPLPVAVPTCFSRTDIEMRWPSIRDIADELASRRSYPDAPVGVLVSRYLLSGLPYNTEDSKVLVILLPAMFTSALPELAAQRPILVNRPSLDCLHLDSAYEWHTVINGNKHILLVSISVMNGFAHNCQGASCQGVTWWPIVFISGDAVISGGMTVDEDEMGTMHATQFASCNYRPYRHFSDVELEKQRKLAEAVGSSIPWENGYWKDEDGVTLVLAKIFSMTLTDSTK